MFDYNQNDDDKVMSEINMTPFVDVMLVLLIIFIIAMPLLNDTIKIDLPTGKHQTNKIFPETITISINRHGNIFWNKTEVSATTLQEKLQAVAQLQPTTEIHLRGDRHVEYNHIIKVMTAVRHAGLQKLGFVTDKTGTNKI